MPTPVRIDVWSDIVCPWCYIGKRRLEAAIELATETHPDIEVELEYHAFQLDPTAPTGEGFPVRQVYEKKFGSPERAAEIIDHTTSEAVAAGLEFNFDIAKRANTVLGHRVLAFALDQGKQLEMKERLLRAYFTEGEAIGQPETLVRLAAEIGLDPDKLGAWLAEGGGEAEVAQDLQMAAENEITAVPTFVFNQSYGVPGALDPKALARVITKLWESEAA